VAEKRTRPGRPDRTLTTYLVLALWCVALFVAGGLYAREPWGAVCLAAGVLTAAGVGLSVALHSWIVAIYSSLLVAAGGMIAAGVVGVDGMIAAGIAALIILGSTVPIVLTLREMLGAGSRGGGGELRELHAVLQEIRDHTMLSDNAKRALYREHELNLLRDAIETDITRGDYNAAIALCDEMADVFGHREEAESFRARITATRQEQYETQVHEAVGHFDALLVERDWAQVHQEAARIRRLFGESHLVQDLDQRILVAREEHKRDLEERFRSAADRDDVEEAMDLLRELDRYLDRHEGEKLSELAQAVVARHRENLGTQFKMAVNDRRWAEAVRIGETIIGEYPNSKMADEVRSMRDLLRTRATHAAVEGR